MKFIQFLKQLNPFYKKHINKYVKKEEVKEITSIKQDGYTFKLKDKVIVRGNEPDPTWTGIIIKFETWDKEHQTPIPIVKDYFTGKEFICFGILVPYSDEMLLKLNSMPPIEQWNYLAKPHSQISEKYGVKYKTYR